MIFLGPRELLLRRRVPRYCAPRPHVCYEALMMNHSAYSAPRWCAPLAAAALLCLLCTLAACGGGEKPADTSQSQPPSVQTQRVAGYDFSRVVSGIDSLESPAAVPIRSGVESTIETVHVQEGAAVRKGEILFSLDARAVEGQLRTARADLESARADLAKAEAENRDNARQDAAAEVARQESRMRNLEKGLENNTIIAPQDGVVTECNVERGDHVEAGQTLATLLQVNPLELSLYIPREYLNRVKPGQHAVVRLETGLIDEHEGVVIRVDPAVDPATNKFQVTLQVDNSDKLLGPGAFASANIYLDEHLSSPAVPEKALVSGPSGYSVFVVQDGVAVLKPVKTGRRRPGLVEIVNGVAVGDKVIVAGQARLKSGSPVHAEGGAENEMEGDAQRHAALGGS